jgi:hypothetical protein
MADRAAVVRLRQEIVRDATAADAIMDDLRGRRSALDATGDRVLLGYFAISLHQIYTALETTFERICRTLEGSLPVGADGHKALLVDMGADLPGLRPPVLSEPSVDGLRELLRFRHFVRNAYVLAWDRARIADVFDRAETVWPRVKVDMEAFVAFLDDLAAELEEKS